MHAASCDRGYSWDLVSPRGKGGVRGQRGQKKYTNRESNPGTKNGNLRCCHYIISVKMHLVRFELTLPKELRLECSALDH